VVIVFGLRNCIGLDRKCTSRCAMYRRYKFTSIKGKLLILNVLQSWGRFLRNCNSFVQTFVAVGVLHSYTVILCRKVLFIVLSVCVGMLRSRGMIGRRMLMQVGFFEVARVVGGHTN